MILDFKIKQNKGKLIVGHEKTYYIHAPDSGGVYLTNDLRVIKQKDVLELFTDNEISEYFYFRTKEEARQAIIKYKEISEFIKEKEFII